MDGKLILIQSELTVFEDEKVMRVQIGLILGMAHGK
jgi:hypothetical protein